MQAQNTSSQTSMIPCYKEQPKQNSLKNGHPAETIFKWCKYTFHIVMQRILHCNFYFMSHVFCVFFSLIRNSVRNHQDWHLRYTILSGLDKKTKSDPQLENKVLIMTSTLAVFLFDHACLNEWREDSYYQGLFVF